MDENILKNISNWKLKEVINDVRIVDMDSTKYIHKVLKKLDLPLVIGNVYDRSQTEIDWNKMLVHYKFFFDREGWENRITESFKSSDLAKTEQLIIPYGWEEPTVMIPTKLFFEDWEGFIASTAWQTIIFSEDLKLIMEISRDYYLHSNFPILKE